jgi:VanZ family protein
MMLPLQYARHWRRASIILLLLVLAATLLPAVWLWPDRMQLSSWFRNLDKWAHLLTFAILALWFAGQFSRGSYWRIALGLFAFGILIEVCQRLVGYRSADLMDIGANTVGIVSGLAIALAGAGGWCLLFETWYTERRAGAEID